MNNQIITQGVVLARTDFQEADRILTIMTPDHGKIKVIAKGVRRSKSKLAGGIELFSVSHITFLPGRKEIGTLISTRLDKHFDNIVKDINRTMLGYELLKRTNRATEDGAGQEYFELLNNALEGLNDLETEHDLIELWFTMQLLKVTGHSPKLQEDKSGNKLGFGQTYLFDIDDMAFRQQAGATFSANHIKLLRLAMSLNEPTALKQINGSAQYLPPTLQLAKTMLSRFVRV